MTTFRSPNRPQLPSDHNFVTTLVAATAQTVVVPAAARVAIFNKSTSDILSVAVDQTIDTSPTASSGTQVATFDSITGATAIALQNYSFGFQTVSFTSAKVESDSTGLAADASGFQLVDFAVALGRNKATGFVKNDNTVLQMVINVDAGGDNTQTFRQGDLLTFGDVVKAINLRYPDVTVDLVADDIRITSNTTGTGSSILIDDTAGTGSTLVLALADYTSVPAATAGTTTAYTVDVDRDGLAAPVTVSVTGDNAQTFGELATEIEADLTGITVTIDSGGILLTSDLDATTSAILISADTLFSVLTDYSAVDGATAAVQIAYEMDVSINGAGAITVSLNATDFNTYTTLAIDIDAAIAAGAACTVVGSTLETVSDATAAGSTIDIVDDNLLSSLAEFLQLEAAVEGNLPQANFVQNPDMLDISGASTIDIESAGTPTVHISFYG